MTNSAALFASLVVFLCVSVQLCQGGVVSTQGGVLIIAAPPSVANGELVSDTEAHFFAEQIGLTLGQDVTVDVTAPGVVETAADLTPGQIFAETEVDTYLLSADLLLGGGGILQFKGAVTFDVPVLGAIVTGITLDATDAILGSNVTSYLPTNRFRGFDGPTFSSSTLAVADMLELSADHRTISFEFLTGIFNDQVRIITATVPEPSLALVDIKPGSFPNSVNLKSKGVLPVAILGTDEFDVHEVDFDSLLFGDPLLIDNGGTGVSPLRSALEDVSGDGLMDLTLKFSVPDLVEYGALGPDSLEGLLTGALRDGTPFEGMDSIRIVPPNGSNGNGLLIRANPEPSTLALAALGLLGIGWRRRNRA